MEQAIQGIRIVTEFVQDGPTPSRSSSIALYAQDRSRPEVDLKRTAYDIQRRDIRKTFRVLVKQRRYQEIPILSLLSPEEVAAFTHSGRHWRARQPHSVRPPSGNFRILINYEKTLDEAVMFDCLARKWRIVNREERTQDNQTSSTETISEAWYLDAEQSMDRYPGFSPKLIRQALCYVTTNGDSPVIEKQGEAPAGLCVSSKARTISRLELPNGEIHEQQYVRSTQILALTRESFAESLFEPPSGFRKMPVYPSRITMARLDAMRTFRHFAASFQSTVFRRTA